MKTLVLIIAALALPVSASAQPYPSRPITLVVPYTPGTGIDIIARTVGPKISDAGGSRLNYSSPGSGTPQHLAVELLKQRLKIDVLHVTYKGAAGALTDLLGGQASREDLYRQIGSDVERWKKFIAETGIKAD